MSQQISAYGLMRRQEAGAAHRGRKRSEESRQRMSEAQRGKPRPDYTLTPLPKLERAIGLVMRGRTQREAAREAGVSLGALQRALKRLGA